MIELSNANIVIKLDEPGDLYKGTRFDHSGYVYSMTFQGVEFCTREHLDQPIGAGGAGICSEFGIFHPPGFDEAAIGEWFLKPGVGLLKKKSEHYFFHEPHECILDTVHIEKGHQSIRLITEGRQTNGYHLNIKRTISLTFEGLIIQYDLENRGSKTILTEEYIHNFIAVDQRKIGPGYFLSMDASVDPKLLPNCLTVDGDFTADNGERLTFHDYPDKAFYFQAKPYRDKNRSNISFHNIGHFQEIDYFTPSLVAVWGCAHALSVESFKKIDLQPGEQLSYQREIVLSLSGRQ